MEPRGYHRFLRAGGLPHDNRTGRGYRLLTLNNTPQKPSCASGGPSPTGRAAAYLYRTSMRVYAVPPLGLEPRTQGF